MHTHRDGHAAAAGRHRASRRDAGVPPVSITRLASAVEEPLQERRIINAVENFAHGEAERWRLADWPSR